MVDVEMPALIGTDPLGFLASLGVLRLTTVELGWASTLGWPAGPRSGAVLGGCPDGSTVETLAAGLYGIVEHARATGQLIPGVNGFPPPKQSSKGSDPVKDLSFADRNGLATTGRTRDRRFGDWLVATLALAARDTDDSRDRLSAAFVRPTGQVSFDRSLKSGRDDIDAADLHAALVEWARVEGVTGNYFDQRAIRDEYVGNHNTGQMKNAGVPGAAWLALMALPQLPVRTTLAGRATTTAFQRRPGRPTRMVWPVWTPSMSLTTASALLDHPALTRVDGPLREGEKPWHADRRIAQSLRALGVTGVFAAERRPGPQGGDGALGPGVAIASAKPTGRRA